ncbi:MAG TPA: hypothetical protein VM639_14790 [Dongiaceae bacterium]|nr:hypothetical protein [Dongiaceae bacterium]
MAEKSSPPTSPVCYLAETPDRYAGFLTGDEIEILIRQWIARSPRPEIAVLLTSLLPGKPPGNAAPTAPLDITTPAGEPLRIEIRSSLPRIRDDEMHRALAHIADLI